MRQRLERFLLNLFPRDTEQTDQKGSIATSEDKEQGEREGMKEAGPDSPMQGEPAYGVARQLPETARLTPEPGIGERPKNELGREPRLEAASRCHVGKVRPRNEDTSFVFISQSGGADPLPLFGLFIVADGMGGHNDGHIASRLVARTVAHHILDSVHRALLQEGHNAMQQPVQEAMEEAVALANNALANAESGKGMGTTLTAAVILGSRLFLVHIGDSRAYLLHDAKLSLVTTDHTFVQALQDAGQLTAEEAAIHPNRNLLYRALMGEKMEEPVDVFTRSLPKNGCLMLCSDGLWGALSESAMTAIFGGEGDLQDKADRLLEAALDEDGHDNITFILVNFVL